MYVMDHVCTFWSTIYISMYGCVCIPFISLHCIQHLYCVSCLLGSTTIYLICISDIHTYVRMCSLHMQVDDAYITITCLGINPARFDCTCWAHYWSQLNMSTVHPCVWLPIATGIKGYIMRRHRSQTD